MAQKLDYSEERLEAFRKMFRQTGVTLAVLAVIRRREVTTKEACRDITRYSAGLLVLPERQVADELSELVRQGYAKRTGSSYHITHTGKNFMFDLIKVWNRYVDSMNNLWGCYYGA